MSDPKPTPPKRVFISATTHDLQSYRKLVTDWAKSKGYIPVVQKDFPTYPHDYSVRDVLRTNLSPCDAVIHLAGLYYGAEPTGYTSPENRRSYTQLEYDLAKILRRQLFVMVASEDYEADKPVAEQTPEHSQLQWQHRQRIRDSGGMRYQFSNHAELSQQLQKIEITGVVDRPNNLPMVGSLFKGRDDFLVALRSKVEGKVGSALVTATKHTIHGLGGIGKTRLAIEYANRYSEHYTALLFVVANSPESLRANIANLCGALRIDEPDPTRQYDAAIKWLQLHPGWFLIVDNVDTKEAAKAVEESILSKLKEGHILVISRLSGWRNRDLDPLELDVISKEASVELLLEGTDGQRKPTQSDSQRAQELAKRLGYLPLALQQAVGFISTRHCSFEEYLSRWDSAEKKVVEWHDELELKYPRSIATTWELSFDAMKPEGREALRLICWLSPDPIPKALLEKVTQTPDPFDMEEGIAELEKYSFLRWVDIDKQLVQVHGLVSDITRYRMSESEKTPELNKAIETAWAFIKDFDASDPATWPIAYRPCREHFFSLIRHSEAKMQILLAIKLINSLAMYLFGIAEYEIAEPLLRHNFNLFEGLICIGNDDLGRSLHNLASLLSISHRNEEAELMLRRAISVREASLGPGHPSVAESSNNLAELLLYADRKKDEAEVLLRRAILIFEDSLGPSHPYVASSLTNLGYLLYETNRSSEAEPLFRRAISIWEYYCANHVHVAPALNNLALLLSDTNRKEEAEGLFRRALRLRETFLGVDHPDVAVSLSTLAKLLSDSNRKEEAEPLLRRAISIWEACLGPGHPDLVRSLLHLAHLLDDTNRKVEAESLFRRAIIICETSNGPEHPDLANNLHDLARLLYQTNRKEEAEPLVRRAVSIREILLGPGHPDVGRSLNNLATLLYETNREIEAEPLFRRSLSIMEASLGPGHHELAGGLNRLAVLLCHTNRKEEAVPLYRRSLSIKEASLGLGHPELADSLSTLAYLLYETNRTGEAEPLFRRAISIYEVSCPDHSKLAKSLNTLACLLCHTNRITEAESLFRRAIGVWEDSLGLDHPDVATSLTNLATLLYETNRKMEAEPLFQRAIKILEDSLGRGHPDVATSLNKLADLLSETSRKGEAESLYRRVISIWDTSRPDDPLLAKSLNTLAFLLYETDRKAEAEPLARRAISIWESSLGADHIEVANGLNNLAYIVFSLNRKGETVILFQRVLSIWEAALGSNHPNVAYCLYSLANLMSFSNRHIESGTHYRRALKILFEHQKTTGCSDPQYELCKSSYTNYLKSLGYTPERIATTLNDIEAEAISKASSN